MHFHYHTSSQPCCSCISLSLQYFYSYGVLFLVLWRLTLSSRLLCHPHIDAHRTRGRIHLHRVCSVVEVCLPHSCTRQQGACVRGLSASTDIGLIITSSEDAELLAQRPRKGHFQRCTPLLSQKAACSTAGSSKGCSEGQDRHAQWSSRALDVPGVPSG